MAEAANGSNFPASGRFSQTVAIFRLTGGSPVSNMAGDGLDSLEQGQQTKHADSWMTYRRIGTVLVLVSDDLAGAIHRVTHSPARRP